MKNRIHHNSLNLNHSAVLFAWIFLGLVACANKPTSLPQDTIIALDQLLQKNDSIFAFESNQGTLRYAMELDSICATLDYPNTFYVDNGSLYNQLIASKMLVKKEGKKYPSKVPMEIIDLNISGEYNAFLDLLTDNYSFIETYKKSLKSTGGINPEANKVLCSALTTENLKDKDLRSMASLHYFVVNWNAMQ